MLLAITNEGKLALGVLAGAFIVFAVLSAFVFPRRNPDFPGNRLGLFIVVACLFFVGTMAAWSSSPTRRKRRMGPRRRRPKARRPGRSRRRPRRRRARPPATGRRRGGLRSAGCGGCHTLEAAGATGKVGPNLDEAKPDEALVIERVTNGMGVMPSFKDQLTSSRSRTSPRTCPVDQG